MAPRLTRAVLALLCAVAVIYGTALFPAAFDVDLRADQGTVSTGPSTPVDPTGHAADSGRTTDDDRSETDTPTATVTPTRTTEPDPASGPPSNDGGNAGGGDGLGGFSALVSGLFVFGSLGAVLVGLLALFGNRDGRWPFSLSALSLTSLVPTPPLRKIPQLTTWLLLAGARGLSRVVDDVGTLGRGVATCVVPVTRIAGRTLTTLPRASVGFVLAPARTLGTAVTMLGGLAFVRGGFSRPGFLHSSQSTNGARSESDALPVTDDPAPVGSVVTAWHQMRSLVPVRNPEATTPGEYAREAVAMGLPAGPVERLTDLFREVRYGDRSDSSDRIAMARRALDALTGGDD